jgi:hypothetical protein
VTDGSMWTPPDILRNGLLPMLRGTGAPIPHAPLDIIRFAEEILGVRLYPRQKTLLRLLFLDTDNMTPYDREVIEGWRGGFHLGGDVLGVPPDVWLRVEWLRSRGYTHFPRALLLIGRRGGKNYIGAIACAYLLYELLLLNWPQVELGIDPDKDLVVFVAATNRDQAKSNALRDLATMLSRTDWFQPYLGAAGTSELILRSSHDLEILEERRARGIPTQETGTLRIRSISSAAPGSRGPAGIAAWFDELAHSQDTPSGSRSGGELWDAVVPALDQAKRRGMVLVTTSPWARTGQAYTLYEQGIMTGPDAGDPISPDILVVQLTSWDPFLDWQDPEATGGVEYPEPPEVWNDILEREEQRNRAKFAVERRSQWAAVEEPFLEPAVIDRAYFPFCETCGHSVPDAGWAAAQPCAHCGRVGPPVHPTFSERGMLNFSYRGHADPAERHDSFAACIAHLHPFAQPNGEISVHVVVDWLGAWRPDDYPDRQLPYLEIQRDMADVIARYPFMQKFSYDQFGAMATISGMRELLDARGVRVPVGKLVHTEATNREREEIVKEALAVNLIHIARDRLGPNGTCLLGDEMRFLELRNGRVVKPTSGPVRTDDLWTAFSTVAWQLLKDQYGGRIREALARAPMMWGLQGGYHTGAEAPPPPPVRERRSVREQLEANSRYWARRSISSRGFPYGLFDPARRKLL